MADEMTAGAVEPRSAGPTISVIVPVRNGAGTLGQCLAAIRQSQGVAWECIVVDDGSTDESAAIARRWGMRLAATDRPASGPGQARNTGAIVADAPLLCFIDADVVIRPDTLARFVAVFEADPALDAAFGSYDTAPAAPDMLSQYRNLLHHFVHQTSQSAAASFWGGCGAIRRGVFEALGGFEPAYQRPSIEDISLGYRLSRAGGRIYLAKDIQVTHLKRWTFWAILRTDIRDRAVPWTALIARTRHLPNDLNLTLGSRASAVSVFSMAGLAVAALWQPMLGLAALAPLLVLLLCNAGLYGFFLRQRGAWFLLRSLPLHWLYFAYSALVFVGGIALFTLLYQRQADQPMRDWPRERVTGAS